MKPIPRKEVLRYLGCRKKDGVSEEAERLVEEVCAELESRCLPRHVQQVVPIAFRDEDTILLCEETIQSKDLFRNLKGCDQAVLLAATLGPECDRIQRRAAAVSMARAAAVQAAGAAMIEAYVNEVCQEIHQQALAQGKHDHPRFSPGYGDLSLSVQLLFSRVLSMPRTIGVSLTDSYLMVPSKSVTALIGLSNTPPDCLFTGCENCDRGEDCSYRREV